MQSCLRYDIAVKWSQEAAPLSDSRRKQNARRASCYAGTGIKRACILVGSQKTLPIAVTVLNGLGSQIGGAVGLAVIPCVVSHLVQIVIDSMLVSQWLKQDSAASGAGQQTALNPKPA